MRRRLAAPLAIVSALAAIVSALYLACPLCRSTDTPQTQALLSTDTMRLSAQRVVGVTSMRISGESFPPSRYHFARVTIAGAPWRVCAIWSHSNRCFDPAEIIRADGYGIVPIAKDGPYQVAEIRACNQGDGIPGGCAVVMPAVQIDTLPAWQYAQGRGRAVSK